MSVIVKGVKMPENCGRCWFNNSSLSCAITGSCIDRDDENRDRLDDCPLVALPDKHGRLIDADALKTAFPTSENATNIKVSAVRRAINRMSTIIEAEGSD
jgi:hypothetical protein